ncbi:MAG: ribonucleotide reductase N-terminal alpha domain-containing protein [Candidatus Paceibacterota bacterium]
METYEDKLIKERYCVDGENSYPDVCERVARFISSNDEQYHQFKKILVDKDFLPNSPTLMNAGTSNPALSACFFLPVEDTIESIFDANKNAAKIFARGGGVGFNFSKLRPAGSKVGKRNGVSSGVVSFMEVFNTMTEVVKQGGRRRGAMMGCLDIAHPEIKNFVTCKQTEGKLSNFNISVKLTDEFMKNPTPEIMNLIVNGIYNNGEPGILFKDTIEKYNPAPEYGELNTNPLNSVWI